MSFASVLQADAVAMSTPDTHPGAASLTYEVGSGPTVAAFNGVVVALAGAEISDQFSRIKTIPREIRVTFPTAALTVAPTGRIRWDGKLYGIVSIAVGSIWTQVTAVAIEQIAHGAGKGPRE